MLLITCPAVIMMFFGVVLSAESNITSNELNDPPTSCYTDRNCPETDYCTDNSVCYPCFSCEKLNQERAVRRCAKGPKDCGRCLPGYSQTSYLSPNKKRICSPIVTSAEPMTIEDKSHFTTNPTIAIGMIILAVLAMAAFASWRCYGKRSTTAIHDSWNEIGLGPLARSSQCSTLPPPSYEDAQRSENGNVAYSFQLRITERPEKQTTAIPFQLPLDEHVVSLAQSSSQQNSNVASNENASNVPVTESETSFQTPNAIDIHDESTQPSMWTPGTAYLMNENIDETDGAVGDKVSPPNKRRKMEEDK